MGMTPEQRIATLLAETEDVARKDQIFLMENSGASAMAEGEIDIKPLLNVVKTLYTKGKEFTSKLFSRSFFDVAKTPDFMKQLGLRGDKFTIRYGVIARHVGKDGSHDLSEKDWERLPKALQTPFAITKLNNKKDSYRIYTTLQTEKGEYIVVGVEVKNAGRDLEVNAVSTAFGRRNDANLPIDEVVIYTDTNITPDQSSLLERPNFAQYPTNQELSTDKGSDNIGDVQGLENYSAEEIKEIAREYIEEVIAENGFDADVVDLAIYGSRRRGDARDDSDLDIVVEYSGNVSEDGLFNALNDAETQLEINGVKVDVNPITKGKSGSLSEFMKRAEEYDSDTKYSLRSNSQEVANIVAKAKADGTYMKAPNGESTNLTEEQWANVRTKAFKDWFGDWENDPENASKVVDENGEPMVVYHGTESDFNVFDRTKGRASMDIQGMFFSPWELDAQGYGRNVRAFYLNIRKPSSGGQSYKALNRYQGQMYAGVKARDYLIGLGYDGVDNYGEEFITFESNQIKSATDNVGTYSSENDDIRYSLRGNVDARKIATYAMKESVMEGQPLFRDGSGALSDADLSDANDPFAKALGKSQRTKAQQAKFAERERKYMRNRVAELVEKLGIGERVELIEGGEFDNERKARAKGWYDAKSGKIVINLANHTSVADIERTLLHEAVSHHGLRELFGKQFDTFLDNVFRSADYNIRTQIVDLATRNGWDFRTATEEYLAQLAEDTNFDALENSWSF